MAMLRAFVFSCCLWLATSQTLLPTLPGGATIAPATGLGPGAPLFDTLPELPATQVVELLCSRQITAVDYVEALYDRYESGGYECLNPFITYNISQVIADAQAIDDKYARGEAITPLCGLPLAVKDAIDVAGYPTTCATPAFHDLRPAVSAPLVQKYLDANGIVLGKTNLGELQSGGSTNPNNEEYGINTALNPYNPVITPSGSSSGSGVSMAARLAPLALCEDTGGSCMGPGVSNGIYSLRPTIGCYNFSDGLMPYQWTRDTVGAMGRNAPDLILLDSIIRSSNYSTTGFGSVPDPVSCAVEINPNFSLAGVRLGLPSTFGWQVPGISGEIANATSAALDKLRAAGAELVPFDSSMFQVLNKISWTGPTPLAGNLDGATSYEAPTTLARWLFLHNYTLDVPDVYRMINRPNLKTSSLETLDPAQGSNEDYIRYLQHGRPNITAYWNQVFADNNFTALLYPQSATETPPIDRSSYAVFYNSSGAFVAPSAGFTGFIPQIAGTSGNFPIGFSSNGIPVGLLVSGPPGHDSIILNLLNQMDGIFGELEPPPSPALCQGCTSNVTYLGPLAYNGTDQPAPGERWTLFGLTFSGDTCAPNLLSYGQSGPTSTGPPPNVTLSYTPITGVTPVSAAG